MGKFGDTGLFDNARGTLQSVREAQDAAYEVRSRLPSLQIEHGLV
jgi:hypothetical protein